MILRVNGVYKIKCSELLVFFEPFYTRLDLYIVLYLTFFTGSIGYFKLLQCI